jgi:outer membrane protein assembly factor BamB
MRVQLPSLWLSRACAAGILAACATFLATNPSLAGQSAVAGRTIPQVRYAQSTTPHTLFVSNELNNSIAALNATTGKPLFTIEGGSGKGRGLYGPVGMVVVPPYATAQKYAFPTLLVCNAGDYDLTEIDALTGKVLGTDVQSRLAQPRGMTAFDNYLYVANFENSTIQVLTFNAGFVTSISGGGLEEPEGLKTDGTRLYAVNSYNDTVSVFSIGGKPLGVISGGFMKAPSGIAIADGKLFVSNSKTSTISVFSQSSLKYLGLISGNGLAEPLGMIVGADVLYVVDHTTNRLSLFNVTTGKAMGTLFADTLDGPVDVYFY